MKTRYIPQGSRKVSSKLCDAVAYIYNNKAGRPCAVIYYGKQSKPVANFRYRNEIEREQSVTRYFEGRRAHEARVQSSRDEQKTWQHSVVIGDIFKTCWGYDQTNIEFFEVVEVSGKFAILRELQCACGERGGPQEKIVPQSGLYLAPRYEGDRRGQPLRRLIQKGYRGEAHIKIDEVRGASPWGERVAGVVVGVAASRTGAGWGH